MSRVVVLGGGESGFGSALLAKRRGFDTFLSDRGTIGEPYLEQLSEHDIPFEQGQHTAEKILSADLIIKSPGIPDNVPLLVQARGLGIAVISEIEFAARYFAPHTRTICITGSNGKTTTTTLIYEIMRDAGMNVALAGNIGRSLALGVASTDRQPDWYVIELSSFQLDGMFDFRADIALLLNITPDHLDRYDYKVDGYALSKFRVARNQRTSDCFILSGDDPLTAQFDPHDQLSERCLFSLKAESAAWLDSAHGVLRMGGYSLPIDSVRIKGRHNMANAMAAMIACARAGVSWEAICATLERFGGVEHRLEYVTTKGGVEYINDSKATNVDSVWYALDSIHRPTIWIAGGTDKGNDYSTLLPLVRERVKALVCMGVDNSKLMAAFEGEIPIYDTHSLEDALAACNSIAQDGDTVLLSPACASFDLFNNYEHRGRRFKEAVVG